MTKRITNIQIEDIAKNIGSKSFYILDIKIFKANYTSFLSTLREYYSNAEIAYSYKTNYIPKLCEQVNQWGGYAEVVSEMEYDLAKNYFNTDPLKIVVNGPIHSKEFIHHSLEMNSMVQVDSFYQLDYIKEYCSNYPLKDIKFGIRFNYELGGMQTSRFGIPSSLDNIKRIKKYLTESKNLHLTGLHCHFSTGSRSLSSFEERAKRLIEIYDLHFNSEDIEYFNFGGGFFSRMPSSLKSQFNAEIPEIEEYAAILGQTMVKRFGNDTDMRMIIEPGTALTADIMHFICPVVEIKNINEKKIVFVDGGIHNIKPTLNNKSLPCYSVSPRSNKVVEYSKYQITGYTCMEKDILTDEFTGHLEVGDYIVYQNVGAYTNVFKPPFIKPQVPIVSIGDNNELTLIKKKEDTRSIIESYLV